MRGPSFQPRTIWLAVAVWLGVAAAGLAAMSAYANRPGQPADAPSRWPAGSHLVLDAARPTLVMIAHPKCDCTRASLAELRELTARAPRAARTYVVFVTPPGADASWNDTVLWQSARSIPDVIAVKDDGAEARHFGAQTSGQVLLYGADGALRFAGGTTIARGHEGDNPGLEAMVSLIAGTAADRTASPVFGCPLFAEAARPVAE
jgi:hypothetical protein